METWLHYGNIPPAQLAQNPLLVATFDALACDELFDVVIDVLVTVFRVYNSDDANMPVVQLVVPRVMTLAARFRQAVADEDIDVARGLCRVFTEMAESFMELLVQPVEMNQLAVVEMVMECTSHPDPEIYAIPFNFWYRFLMRMDKLQEPHKAAVVTKYTACLSRLVDCSVKNMHYPPGYASWPEDRREDQRRLRNDLADTLDDCTRVLGAVPVLQHICTLFTRQLQLYQQATQQAGAAGGEDLDGWQGVEACMYAARSIARQVDDKEAQVMPQIVQVIPQLQGTHHLLRYTSTLTVGSYSSWIAANHAQHLSPLFTFVVNGLTDKRVAPASAMATKKLCKSCGAVMGEPVLNMLTPMIVAPSCSLPIKDQLWVLEGLCSVIAQLPLDVGMRCLANLVKPIADRLNALVSSQPPGSDKEVVREFERLTASIRSINPKEGTACLPQGATHPVVSLFTSLWPIFNAVLAAKGTSGTVVENLCRCYKHSLRTGGKGMAVALPPMITQLVGAYSQHPHSPYLYAASICIGEYGKDQQFVGPLMEMSRAMALKTFSVLKTFDDFTAHPDVVEEFFYLIERLIKSCPKPLVESGMLPALVQAAVVGLPVQQREASR
jgi:transportin-3